MLLTNGSVRLLFIGQALYWSCSLIGITLTSLVGMQLAPVASLATLPLALLVLGNLVAVHPLSIFMQRYGRRRGLVAGAMLGVVGGLISAWGVYTASFTIFCLGALPIGAYQASAMYYRYAALETVPDAQKGRAAAFVVGGGVIAALIAPGLAVWSRDAIVIPFLGSYLVVAALALLACAVMCALPQGGIPARVAGGWGVMAKLLQRPQIRAAIAISAAGHGIMILVMNATPLAMKFCGFDVDISAQVIQWHIIGMFLPAFVAGPLMDRYGPRKMAMAGVAVLVLSAAVALSGQNQTAFLISSFLLGLGWNLMLLAGTTLLGEGHDASERGHAQGAMELGNGLVGTFASFASGALIVGAGWDAINIGMIPVLAIAVLLMWAGRGARIPKNA
ncbi:MAG: MFS transporter [Pseudomonadota bacterium]